ncbi:DUF1330 domain-containing protein [Oceaniglobus roseus]|uniref:DUF1330 domain-containing protein n=1 Tax=Oceaniglobus roseus TaxID=1737570 RepID=UPI000C7F1960|nr:DUF1330 domain-containing protein [Kandeliimicrobium roseum]
MPKGYWIANNIVHDPETYERYKAANGPVFARYNARFVVRGGQQKGVEGEVFPRTVVIEFPSYAEALACYEDPEYAAAKAIRDPVSEGRLLIVEGYEG